MNTVRVRIAVVVNADGKWSASGWSGADDDVKRGCAFENMSDKEENHDTLHWIEADVPVPQIAEAKVIEAEVS